MLDIEMIEMTTPHGRVFHLPKNDFYNSASELRGLLAQNELTMQKRFGQNFLINQSARERIVEALDMDGESVLWEVGPGMGAITSLMAGRCKHLTLFEIDRGFILLLKELYNDVPDFTIEEGDALKNWSTVWEREGIPTAVVGNLPYNIGSRIIASFIEKGLLPQRMVFTLQKEVALRMTEKAGGDQYSSFSMLCGLDYRVKRIMDINPGSFYPRPDVISSVVLMEKRVDRILFGYSLDNLEIRGNYFKITRDFFKSRRKTIRNNLVKSGFLSGIEVQHPGLPESFCGQCNIDLSDRGENISVDQVWQLAGIVNDAQKGGLSQVPRKG